MALSLIVEDGSAKTVANSYVTLQEFLDYWELRNDTAVAALSDEAATAALVQAAQYLDHVYRYIGVRYLGVQAMSWPRAVIGWDVDGRDMEANTVPQRVKDAQCELARESAVGGSLLPSQDRGGRVASQSVGPISVSYFSDAVSGKEYPIVDALLADLLEGGGITTSAVLA